MRFNFPGITNIQMPLEIDFEIFNTKNGRGEGGHESTQICTFHTFQR